MTISTKTVRRWATEGFPDLEKAFDERLSELIRKEREEAWDEGRNSTDSEYEHLFNGHPVPEGEMCGECEQWAQNPYRR